MQAILSHRSTLISKLSQSIFDLVVIGGGATGLGVALDAVSRGLKVALLEAQDFSKGASSRSTKLIHGGVRYLAEGDIALVKEALSERKMFINNAPHLAQALSLVVPSYHCWQKPFYGVGLKIYDVLSSSETLGKTQFLNRTEVIKKIKGVNEQGLKGGVLYWDGQFDDARVCVELAQTAHSLGAVLLNYCLVKRFEYHDGKLSGLYAIDQESEQEIHVRAKVFINCTGAWGDKVREVANQAPIEPRIQPSQGVHLVVDRSFLPGNSAILQPKTSDGRVLFVIPWLGKVLIGTTDSPQKEALYEPQPLQEEIDFLFRESAKLLSRAPQIKDILSHWVGMRPLVSEGEKTAVKKISRRHKIFQDEDGLITISGGKWTIYRRIAQDAIDFCVKKNLLTPTQTCQTGNLALIGAAVCRKKNAHLQQDPGLHLYGDQASSVLALVEEGDKEIALGLTPAMVRFAVRYEFARTVEDVLARRWRMLFLDAELAQKSAAQVASILEAESIIDTKLKEFLTLAESYKKIKM